MSSLTLCVSATFEICLLTATGKARAFQFLKKFALQGRKSDRKSKGTVPPVTLPAQDFQRAHSSVDLLRKPDISRFIGLRVEDGPNPMDTDDSSQDASASGNSPRIRPRRHSAWDSLRSAPVESTFTGHDAAPLFFQAGLGSQTAPGSLPAPAPLFFQSDMTLDADTQLARSSGLSPEIPPRVNVSNVSPETKFNEEAVQDTLNNDTPRLSGSDLPHDDTLMNPMTDLTSSTFSDSCIPSRIRPLSAEDPTSETTQGRPALLPHHTAPLPPPFRLTVERGLRLSPSIITRQPLPLLNLPALPTTSSAVSDALPRQRVRLRSMPSLSRHGRSNAERQADHENATLGDSDEEEEDDGDEEEFVDASSVHQSDDEDDEPPSAGLSGTQSLKSSQKRRMTDEESPTETPISLVSTQSDSSVQSIDGATSHISPALHLLSPNIPIAKVTRRQTLDPDAPIPRTGLESKPSLYRVGSRSMINLGSTRRAQRSRRPREVAGSNLALASGHEFHEESEESDTEAIGRLLRRTSMPTFRPTSDPPPYPAFTSRSREGRLAPHEDEEQERLPPYSNSLHLIAIMPRKMEFSSPGVQAKDRKWRRVVCELEGTTFRVYKCPPGASGAGVLGDWWEKHVGAGDVAGPNPPRTRKKDPEDQPERSEKLGIDEPPIPVTQSESSAGSTSVPLVSRRTGSQSSLTTQSPMISTPRQAKRVSAASFLSPFRTSSSTRAETSVAESSRHESRELELLPVDTQDSRSSLHESTGRASPVTQRLSQPPPPRSASRLTFLSVATGRTPWRNGEISKPPRSDLLRAYTLQHAESGLGNDYLKRKHVIRVRLEGEQFLLQAPDIPAVVEWIEVCNLQVWRCGSDRFAGAPRWDQHRVGP